MEPNTVPWGCHDGSGFVGAQKFVISRSTVCDRGTGKSSPISFPPYPRNDLSVPKHLHWASLPRSWQKSLSDVLVFYRFLRLFFGPVFFAVLCISRLFSVPSNGGFAGTSLFRQTSESLVKVSKGISNRTPIRPQQILLHHACLKVQTTRFVLPKFVGFSMKYQYISETVEKKLRFLYGSYLERA